MTDSSDRVLDLLERWQSLEQQGRSVTAAEVCADCPELAGELERLAHFARRVTGLATDPAGQSTDVPDQLPTLEPRNVPVDSASSVSSEDRYAIEGKLGEGGMGTVYRVHDRQLGRIVAMKVIRPEAMSLAMRARFEAEARAVARLDHPNIVKVFDVGQMRLPGESALVPFLTLEFVEGGNLAKRLEKEPLPTSEALRLTALLARAMQHAHERGIVHRDLKPDNVLLAPAGSVAALNTAIGCPKITDFGLARQVSSERRLTQDGAVMGTPAYMAPEQAEGQSDIGPPADVWALGVILYQLLAGSAPFRADSLVDLLHMICRKEPDPLEQVRPGLPAELSILCRDCLRKQPEKRPTAGQLAERLERFLHVTAVETKTLPEPMVEGRGSRPRRARMYLLAALVLIALGAGLAWSLRPREASEDPRTDTKPTDDKKPPVASKPLKIRPLKVIHYERVGEEKEPRGRIGDKSFATRHGDMVTLTVELSEAACFYVIGFTFEGKEQLLWPVDEKKDPSDQVVPPRLGRLEYPKDLYLDDEAKSGLQAYVVAASTKPLPAYAEWRSARTGVNWKALPAGKIVWEADAQATYAVTPGLSADRGSIKEPLGVPPLAGLCRALLAGGVETVECLAFPVLPKEGGR